MIWSHPLTRLFITCLTLISVTWYGNIFVALLVLCQVMMYESRLRAKATRADD